LRDGAYAGSVTREVPIRGEVLRLGQLLKVAGFIEAGGEAKGYLSSHRVLVNGEPEERRGRQLRAGDEVRVGDAAVRLVAGDAAG
jgi:ribosome-associated protein